MLVAVASVHAADELFTNLPGKVEVDVGHRRQRLVEKTAQEQVVAHRIDVRQTEEVADDGRDRGAPSSSGEQVARGPARAPAHVHTHLARQLEQVVVHQEEAAQLVMLHQPQLLLEAALGLGAVGRIGWVELLQLHRAQSGQGLWSGLLPRAAEVGEGVAQIRGQVEGAAPLGDRARVRDGVGTVTEQRRYVLRRSQMKLAVGLSHVVRAVERGAVPNGAERVVQPVPLAPEVVRIAGGDHREPRVVGYVGERMDQVTVAAHVVALELHEEPLSAEQRSAALCEVTCRSASLAAEHRGQQAVATSREHYQPLVARLQRGEVEPRVVPVFPAQVRLRDQAAEVGVALGRFGKEGEV